MTDQLLPCPFCGSTAELDYDGEIKEYFITCPTNIDGCFGHMFCGPFKQKKFAIDAWNYRPGIEYYRFLDSNSIVSLV